MTDVQKLIKAGVDEAMRGYHTERQSEQQRTDYVGQKMKDLPAAYQRQLGSDPSKWPAEEQAIRQQFQADFKSAGGKVPDVGGPVSGGVVKPIQLTGERKGDPTARLGAAIDRGVK